MAVNSTEYKKIYNTNGTTGPFAITFPVRLDSGGDADDIKVYYRTAAGVESDITSTCTIAGLNVTLGTAYAAGGKIALVREPDLKQLSVYSYGTRFPASQFESDLDYAMFCAQKVESETARALRVPITDAAANLDIPNEEDRKGKFLYFNVDTGLPEAAAGVTGVPVSTFMETVLDDADAGAALTTLGITAYAQTLLDDADAGAALTTLGVSDYAKTLLDDATAGAALTTLGISAYAQTLLDDADAATARGTLDVYSKAEIDTITYGAIGTYVIAASTAWEVSTAYLPGTTVAGNTLVFDDTPTDATNGASLNSYTTDNFYVRTNAEVSLSLTGTWMLCTKVFRGSSTTVRPMGLFVRTA